MTPETWTIAADSSSNYSPSVTFDSSSCATVTNINYTNTNALKTRARNSSINLSLSITTGDSSYVLILGFCDDATRTFNVVVAGVTIWSSFSPGTLAGTCKVIEIYTLFTLSNSGTKITINGSAYTQSTTNAVVVALSNGNNGVGQAPIINYTIWLKETARKRIIAQCVMTNFVQHAM
ncbi:unnamed protein product [Blepharisma stoltei]|uniref:Uncharacterized protein n=1 Tax=Blepharisma stoltei TaxID=1481888 RepID=A0AAU9KF07_9CILI|nr:unnamed protein product [Blepharisma stoltei]